MGVRKRALAVVTAGAIALFGAIGMSPQASAAYNCTTGYTAQGWAFGKCLTGEPGGNYYRVNVFCQNRITLSSRVVHGHVVHVNHTNPSIVDGCGNWLERFYGQPWTQTMWQ